MLDVLDNDPGFLLPRGMITTKLRIVAIADTHLEHDRLGIPEGDILIHAGDMCDDGAYHELRTTAEWFRSLPHRHKIAIAGNHDWAFIHQAEEARALFTGPCTEFKSVRYLQDEAAFVEGIRFYGSPWQPEFFNWAFGLPRGKALASVWSRIPRATDVLITHGPPKGFGDKCFYGGHVGCEDLLRRVRAIRPKLHIYGHIHTAGGVWREGTTYFVNVTTGQGRRPPTVIDYEPLTGKVTMVSVPSGSK